MNKSNFTNTSKLKKSALKILFLSSLIFTNLSSTDHKFLQIPKPSKHPENSEKPAKRTMLDFQSCNSRQDIIDLLMRNNWIKTINPADYFIENDKLISELDIFDMETFWHIYQQSDIMRYAIYTQIVPKSKIENINKLNINIAIKSDYTNYIYIKNILTLKNFNVIFDKIVKNEEIQKKILIRKKREKLHPNQKYKPSPSKSIVHKIHKNIPKQNYDSYEQEWVVKIPRREVSRLLKENNILLNSSSKGFDEIGNNKTFWRTCLHGIQKRTLDFLISLPGAIASEYSDDLLEYKPIVVTWLTEDWHIDYKLSLLDHPSWAKFDISTKWVRWVILAKYFAKFWITQFDHIYKNISINGFTCDIYIHDGGNGIHFDILVK